MDDGQDSKDFRPDAVVVKSAITHEDLEKPGGWKHVHLPIELKVAAGKSDLGQIGGYSTVFRAAGSRYQVDLSIRQHILRLFILMPTGWAVVREQNYQYRTERLLQSLRSLYPMQLEIAALSSSCNLASI